MDQHCGRVPLRLRMLPVFCGLLILLAGFAQGSHLHASKSNSPVHECSICSVMHSPAMAGGTFELDPAFLLAELACRQKPFTQSVLPSSSLDIRPPPLV
jgi:hypothetical protein